MTTAPIAMAERLAKERRARLAAERHLEWKTRELAAAHEKLALQARALSDRVVEERQTARAAQSEAARLRGQNERYLGDLDRAHTTAVMAERRLRTSIDAIRDGFAVFDGDNRLVLANRALLAPFAPGQVVPGMAYADLLAKLAPMLDLDLPAADWITGMIERLHLDPIPPVDLAFREGRWIRLEDRLARDGDRVCLAIDITGEMRLRAAIEAIPDGFVIFDREERLTICNQNYRDIYAAAAPVIQPGARFEDILRASLAAGLHSDATGREEAWLAERMAEFRAASGHAMQHLSDGRWIRAQEHPTPDGGRVGLRSDISAEREAQETLRNARAAAEAASHAKSAFLANMSHEIRTPMNGVVGMAELLCGTDLTEEQRLFAETIRSSGEALLTIINDILDYSKIEAGRLILHPEPFDLERLIHETAILLQSQARAKQIDLHVDYDMFLPTRLVGDAVRLRQILTNLMGNAVKFTGQGHVLIRVVGDCGRDGVARLHLTVEDTGIGIAPDQIDHIFGEFNQVETAENRRYQGTGLGLAITRRLVDMMEGELWVDSTPGEGSCFGFVLSLPVAEDLVPATLPTSLRRVLLAETSPVNRAILERQLLPLGVVVTVLRPGETLAEALAGGAGAGLDLLLVDSGSPAQAELPALCLAGKIPPVLLMAPPDQLAEAEVAVARGEARAVIAKPVLRAELFAALARIIGTASPAATAQARVARRLRVLAAEDNKTNQLVFAKMVRDLDLDLRFADDGRQAVDQWRDFRPDLIFMDISMPEMDGCTAARTIRAAEAGLAHVPIIALTAHVMEEDTERILASGIDQHLTKPLRKSVILDVLHRYCGCDARTFRPSAAATAA